MGRPHRPKSRSTYEFKLSKTHPLFPNVQTIFQVTKPGYITRPTVQHAIVITSRDVLPTQFYRNEVEFVHSQNLGGKQGPMVAHVFKELSQMHTKTPFAISLSSRNQVRDKMQESLKVLNVPFKPSEVNTIVKKLKLG